MRDAVAELVRDGDVVAIEGFTHLICFAAGHEIIRQRKRDLTLCRLTPDVIYDQMVAAGVAMRLVFSWLGNPGVGSLHAIRRRVESADPEALEVEEYSHFGMVCRYLAGAANLPFIPIRSYHESDLPTVNPRIVPVASPYGDETVYAVPPLNPDVTIVHAQRSDSSGNAQIWGVLGCQREAAFAARRVIVVCEELVDESVIRADPNRTLIPGLIVDAWWWSPGAATPPTRRATTTGTIASTWSGTPSAGTRRPWRPGSRSGCTTWRATGTTWRSSGPSGGRPSGPGRPGPAR